MVQRLTLSLLLPKQLKFSLRTYRHSYQGTWPVSPQLATSGQMVATRSPRKRRIDVVSELEERKYYPKLCHSKILDSKLEFGRRSMVVMPIT